jgi:magnesium transporter
VIIAFAFSPASGVRSIAGEAEIREALRVPDGLVWVDFDQPTDEEARLLQTLFRFHELAIEDCVQESLHPKVDSYGEYLYLVVHGVVGDSGASFRTQELDAFLGRNYLVTFHYENRRSIKAAQERVRLVAEPMAHGPDGLLVAILEKLIDNYEPALEHLDRRIAAVEEKVFSQPDRDTLNEMFTLRKEVLHLRRIILPQRETIHRLARGEFPQIAPATAPFFRDLYDHLYRIGDLCEGYRDLLGGALEAYLSMVSSRLNEVMKVLTVISTIILPLTLVAGIYGMNFRHMPELEWRHGYLVALSLMAAIALGMIAFFRRRGWF